jgi:hypothetical protein
MLHNASFAAIHDFTQELRENVARDVAIWRERSQKMRQEIRDRLSTDEASRRRLLTTGAVDLTKDLALKARLDIFFSPFYTRCVAHCAAHHPPSLLKLLLLRFLSNTIQFIHHVYIYINIFFFYSFSAELGAYLGCRWCR